MPEDFTLGLYFAAALVFLGIAANSIRNKWNGDSSDDEHGD